MKKCFLLTLLFLCCLSLGLGNIQNFYNHIRKRAEINFNENLFIEEFTSVINNQKWGKATILTRDMVTINATNSEAISYKYFAVLVLKKPEVVATTIKKLNLKGYNITESEIIDEDLYFTLVTENTTVGFNRVYGNNQLGINTDLEEFALLLYINENIELSNQFYISLETNTSTAKWFIDKHDQKYLELLNRYANQ